MRKKVSLCVVALAVSAGAWAGATKPKEPEPSFTAPPVKLVFQLFGPGRQPQTPGKISGASRRMLDRKPWNEPLKMVIPEKGGVTILAETKGNRFLAIDVDGDKRYKGPLENLNLGRSGHFGPTQAVCKWPDGTRMYYGFVIHPPPRGATEARYELERAGAMMGRAQGKIVQLIDDNSNGLYDEYGTDVIVVGKRPPVYLGKMVILGGVLHHMKVTPAGHRLFLAKYQGVTGKADMVSGYKPPKGAKLASAALKMDEKSFDVVTGDKETAVSVPEGSYELSTGLVKKFNYEVPIVTGKMKPVAVKAAVGAAVPKWGAPFRIDFTTESKIMGLTIKDAGIYGSGGELYLTPKEPAPFVIVYVGGRPVFRKQMEYGADGKLREFFFDPKRSGTFQVEIVHQSPLFGKLSSGKRDATFSKKF